MKVDGVAPQVTGVTPPAAKVYATGEKLTFTVNFDDAVAYTKGAADATLAVTINGIVRQATIASTGTAAAHTFEYTIQTADASSGSVTIGAISLNGSTFRDTNGNDATLTGTAGPTTGIIINRTAVTGVAASTNKTYKLGEVIELTATLSQAVTVTGVPTIALTVGQNPRTAAYASGSGTTSLNFRYTVVANEADADGIDLPSSVISLPTGAALVDANANAVSLSFTPPDTTGIKVDAVAPTVQNVTGPASGTYTTNAVLTFTAALSEAVTVTGAPTLSIAVGTATRQATYDAAASTATSLVFNYTVLTGDATATGITVNSISLGAATVRDAAGNDANLTFTAVSLAGIVVNRNSVTSVTASADKTYKIGDVIQLMATFAQPVTVTGTPTLALTLGTVARTAEYFTGSGTSSLKFRYQVQSGDLDLDGIDIPRSVLSVPVGASISDTVGALTSAQLSFVPPATAGIIVDGVAPTIQTISTPAGAPAGFAFSDFSTTPNLQLNGSAVASDDIITLTPDAGGTGSAWYTSPVSVAADFETRFRFRIFNTTPSTGDGIAFVIQNQGANALGGSGGAIGYDGITSGLAIEFDTVRNTAAAHSVEVDDPDGNHISIQSRGTIPLSADTKYSLASTSAIADFSDSVVHDVLVRYSGGTLSIFLDNFDSPVLSYGIDLRTYLGLTDGNAFVGFTAATGANVSKHEVYSWSFTSASVASSIGFGGTGYRTGDTIRFTVPFSEPVVVTGSPTLSLTLGPSTRQATLTPASIASAATAPGATSLEFVYTIAPDDSSTTGVSANTINLNGGTIKDAAGNTANTNFAPVTSGSFTVNRSGITSVSVASKTYKVDEAIDFLANFSNTVFVSGVPRIQFFIDNSATPRNATFVNGTGTATLRFRYVVASGDLDSTGIEFVNGFLDLNGGSIKDVFNASTAVTFTPPSADGVRIDGVVPTVTSVTGPSEAAYATGAVLTFTVGLSEDVSVTGSPTLAIGIGGANRQATYDASTSTATNLIFKYAVSANDVSITGISIGGIGVGAATIKDLAGNNASMAFTPVSLPGVIVNRTALSSVTASADKPYKAGDVIEFTTTFSGPVTVSGAPSITLTVGAASKAAAYTSGSGTSSLKFRYTVVAGDVDTDGIDLPNSTITMPAGASIVDANTNAVALSFTPPATSGILVDAVVPTLALTPPDAGNYVTGNVLTFVASTSEATTVAGAGTPTLALTFGNDSRVATYNPGLSSATRLVFQYTITDSDSANGIAIGAISLNGATDRDAAGNDINTAHSASGAGVVVNRTLLQSLELTSPAIKTYRVGEFIEFTATFSLPVTVTGVPTLALIIGTLAKDAKYISGSGTNTLVFRYTVANNDNDNDGIEFAGSTVGLVNAAITNKTVPTILSFTAPDVSGAKVDAVIPTLTRLTGPAAGTYRAGDSLQFTATFSESMKVTPASDGSLPRIAVVIGNNTRYATYIAGNETPVLVFTYQVSSGELDADGIVASTVIQFNNALVTDLAGNSNVYTFLFIDTSRVFVDSAAPTVTRFSVPATTPNGSYKVGSVIRLIATLSEPVLAGSILSVTLDTGAQVDLTTAVNGVTLSGSYVVAAGENSSDLTVVSFSDVNVTDLAGNPLGDTTLPTGASNIDGARAIVIDTTAPTVLSFTSTTPNGIYRAGTPTGGIVITATLSEPIAAGSSFAVMLDSGAVVTLSTIAQGTTLTGTYVVAAGQNSPDLTVAAFTAGTVRDLAGNTLDASLPPAGANLADTKAIVIDTTAPLAAAVPLEQGSNNLTDGFLNLAESATTTTLRVVLGGSGAVENDRVDLLIGGVAFTPPKFVTLSAQNITDEFVDLTVTGAELGVDGSKQITARVTDQAGNVGAISPALSFVKDTAAPIAPTIVIAAGVTPPVSRAEATLAAGIVSLTAEARAAVTLTFTGTAATVTKNVTGTGTNQGIVLTDADVSSLGDGSVAVSASQVDAVGNPQTAAPASLTFSIDSTAPTVSSVVATGTGITSGSGTLKAGAVVTLTVNTSEAVTVNTAGGTPTLSLSSGGTATYASGSGTTSLVFAYTVGATDSTSDLTVTALNANGGTLTDTAGNALATFTNNPSGTLVIDTTAPTVSNCTSSTADGAYKAGSTISIQLQLSENVTVVGSPTLALNVGRNATFVNVTGGNILNFTYTVVTGDTTGDLDYDSTSALALNGATIRDAAGNNATLTLAAPNASGSLGANKAIVIDTTAPAAPTVTALMTNIKKPTITGTAILAAGEKLSVVINGFTFTNVPVTSGKWSLNTATASTTSGTFGNLVDGTYPVTATVNDTAGNSDTTSNELVIDTVAPMVRNVTSSTSNGIYKAGSPISIQVQMSESVTVVGSPTLALNVGRNATFVEVTGDNVLNFTYTVQTGDTTADLDYASTTALTLNDATIRDATGNNAIPTLAAPGGSGSLGANKNIAIDAISPTVLGVDPVSPSGSYKVGAVITLRVRLAESVNVTGTPRLLLNSAANRFATYDSGSGSRTLVPPVPDRRRGFATYDSGSGSSTLLFRYVVQRGDNVAVLDYASTAALILNGGTISDTAGNPAILTLVSPGAAGSISSTATLRTDTIAPTVSSLTSLATNGTYGIDQTVYIAINMRERVYVAGSPLLLLNTTPARYASYVSGSGTKALVFAYTVQLNDVSSRLDNASATALISNGALLRDGAGNDARLALPVPGTAAALAGSSALVIDGLIRATASGFGTSPDTAPGFTQPVTKIALTFNTPVTGFTLNDLRLFYEGRSVSLTGAVLTGSGSSWTLSLPRTATSLKGNYRLDIGGQAVGVTTGGSQMTTVSSVYWRRV